MVFTIDNKELWSMRLQTLVAKIRQAASLLQPPQQQYQAHSSQQLSPPQYPSQPQILPEGVCPNCNNPVSLEFAICPFCGAKLKEIKHKCPKCGKEVNAEFKVCPYCGATL